MWAGAIRSEIILPLWQPQMSDHKPVVGSEGGGEIVPEKWSVQEPHLTLLSYYTYTERASRRQIIWNHFVCYIFVYFWINCGMHNHLMCNSCKQGKPCHYHCRGPAQRCGYENQNEVFQGYPILKKNRQTLKYTFKKIRCIIRCKFYWTERDVKKLRYTSKMPKDVRKSHPPSHHQSQDQLK